MATAPRTHRAGPCRRRGLLLATALAALVWLPSALAVGDPPVNSERPAISGIARYAQTLTGTRGVWTGAEPITYTNQWRRCDVNGNACADIPGATALGYTLGAADIGARLTLRITASNAYGTASQRSWLSATVVSPPVNTALPTLSGIARRGQTLMVAAGTWIGTSQITYAYQWRRCDADGANCVDIIGATGTSYVLASADVGNRVHARVAATNAYGSVVTRTWNSSGIVGAPENTSPPTVSGQAAVGQIVSGAPGAWSGTTPITYTYQWRRCDSSGGGCADVAGATASTYAVLSADAGKTLRVTVSAANAYGSSTATSAPTPVVTSSGSPLPPPSSGVIDVKASFGTSDSAVRAAIAAAQSSGKDLYFSSATYTYTSALVLDGITAYGDGPTSVLSADNPASSAVILRGARPVLRDLTVTSPNAVARSQAYIRANVQVDGASDFVIERVVALKAEQNGIIVVGASRGTIADNTVSQTFADGIHITDGARDVVVSNNTVRDAGDDLIAVVSYLVDPLPCKNITIEDNAVYRQTNGRGISNVGGESVTIQRNTISQTHGAGILVAADGDYGTYGPVGTRVLDNVIDTTDLGDIHHAGIQVFGQPGNVARDTLVRGNIVKNARYRGIYVGASSETTTVTDNELTGIAEQGIYANGARDLTVISNTLTGIGTYGVYARGTVSGTLVLRSNSISFVNASREQGVDVVHVEPNTALTSGEIAYNRYTPSTGGVYDELVESTDPKIVVIGNVLVS